MAQGKRAGVSCDKDFLKSLPCRKKVLVSGQRKDHEAQENVKNNQSEM